MSGPIMSAGRHPWLRLRPDVVAGRLDQIDWDAASLFYAVSMYVAASGGDGTIAVSEGRPDFVVRAAVCQDN